MVVTATAAATAAAAMVGAATLGGIALVMLILSLMGKEITANAGNVRLLPVSRGLTIAIVPLALAVAVVLIQQFSHYL